MKRERGKEDSISFKKRNARNVENCAEDRTSVNHARLNSKNIAKKKKKKKLNP